MEEVVESIIRKYGSELQLIRGEDRLPFRGFLQPVREKSQQAYQREETVLGEFPRGKYVFMAEADCPAAEGDILQAGENYFDVCRTELMYGTERPAYLWGLCRRREWV